MAYNSFGYNKPAKTPEQIQRDQEDHEEALLSKHVSRIGEGILFPKKDPLTLLRIGKPFLGRGGVSYVVLTLVHELDRFKIFMKEADTHEYEPGDQFVCRAAVTKHETYRDAKSTVLSISPKKRSGACLKKI